MIPRTAPARLGRAAAGAASHLLIGDLKLAFPGRTAKLDGPAVHLGLEHARRTRGEDGDVTVGI